MAKKKNLPLEDSAQQRLTLTVPDDAEKASVRDTDLFSQNQEPEDISAEEVEYLTVGDRLRVEREKRGLTPHEMADQLRLRPRQIIALEAGDYANLPGQAFVTGFLRSYANALDLDAVELVKLYKTEHEGAMGAPQLAFPEPTSEGRMPGGSLIIGTCVVAAIAFGGWHFYQEGTKAQTDLVPELPGRLAAKLEEFTKPAKPAETPPAVQENSDAAPQVAPTEPAIGDTQVTQNDVPPSAAPVSETDSPVVVAGLADQEATENAVSSPARTATDQEFSDDNNISTQAVTSDVPASSAETVSETETGTAQSEREVTDPTDTVDTARVERETNMSPSAEQPLSDNTQPMSRSVETTEPQTETVAALARTLPEEKTYPQAVLENRSPDQAVTADRKVPETLGVENSDARIILLAHQETWIQVTGADQAVLLDRVLEAGDTYMVPVGSGLKLNTANAAGLEVRLDGAVLGTLGNYGRIIRDMALEPDHLRSRFSSGTE